MFQVTLWVIFIMEITLVIADISFFDYFRYVSFQYNCRDYLHDFSWVINRVFLQQNLRTVLDGIITRYVWAFVWLLCLYKKAFDTVWHDGLWYKLRMCNIKGKMYHVILNLYNNIKSRIVYNDSVSNFFPCLNGVRQGENVYPFSFVLYLNDLENFLISKNAQGVKKAFPKTSKTNYKFTWNYSLFFMPTIQYCWRIAVRVKLFLRILWKMEL